MTTTENGTPSPRPDMEKPETTAEAIAEKWLARIPEVDREIVWTAEQIKCLLFVLTSTKDGSKGGLFGTNDKLANLPKCVFNAVYASEDENPTKSEIVEAFGEFVADPIAASARMDKIIVIEESGLPLSVIVALKSIILCEGDRPAVAVFRELMDTVQQSSENPHIIDILTNGSIRKELITPEAQKNDDTRRSAAIILLTKLWSEFVNSREVLFYIELDKSLPKNIDEARKIVEEAKRKFQEIFQEEFQSSEALQKNLRYFSVGSSEPALTFGDISEQTKDRIIKKLNPAE